MSEESTIDKNRMLTAAAMADLYACPSAEAFKYRYYRDSLKPPELRLLPDPINPYRSRGTVLLWDPVSVAEHRARLRKAAK